MKLFSDPPYTIFSMSVCQLLPPPKQTGYNLRSRGHGLPLPELQFEYLRKNVIHRRLYTDINASKEPYTQLFSLLSPYCRVLSRSYFTIHVYVYILL